jgi:hypothetical protein
MGKQVPRNQIGIIIGLGLVLASCQSEQPATGKALEKIVATCAGYGFNAGTDAYAACVLQLDQNRIAQNRNTRLRIGAALSAAGNGMQANAAANRPVNCSTYRLGSTLQTRCY